MQDSPIDREVLRRWSFLILFAIIAYLFWKVASPLWLPICIGALVAVGMLPLHKKLVARLQTKTKSAEAISAMVITLGVLVVCLALASFFSIILLRQALSVAHSFADKARSQSPEQMLGPGISKVLAQIGENPQRLQEHLATLTNDAAGLLANSAGSVLAASGGVLLVIIFTVITSYYLLRHGERFTKWLVMVLPLPDGEVWELVRNFRDVARVMLMGTGVTAVYQGATSFIGYWIAGVPNPVLWGTATGMASIVPAVGTTIIWGPVVVYLFLTHHIGWAIGLLLYVNAVTVGIADYVLRPKLLGSKVKMNDLLIFIALFGGIEAFGILGTILGPIIAALLMAMIHIYLRDYRPKNMGGGHVRVTAGGREEVEDEAADADPTANEDEASDAKKVEDALEKAAKRHVAAKQS